MIHPEGLLTLYAYNYRLINLQCENMTHADSLIQPPFEANCINWILGHIISGRTFPLRMLGEEPVWTDEQRARYRHRSLPVTGDGVDVVPLDVLLATFNESQVRLERGLGRMSSNDLMQPSGFENQTIAGSLLYFQFHEAHHAGQMTVLSPLAGIPGAWIS